MNQSDPLATAADSARPPAAPEPPDHGVNLVSVLVALAVLAALVVGIFWGLPAWFESSIINVTVRQ